MATRMLSEEDKARAFETVLRHDAFVVPGETDRHSHAGDYQYTFTGERRDMPCADVLGRPTVLHTGWLRRT